MVSRCHPPPLSIVAAFVALAAVATAGDVAVIVAVVVVAAAAVSPMLASVIIQAFEGCLLSFLCLLLCPLLFWGFYCPSSKPSSYSPLSLVVVPHPHCPHTHPCSSSSVVVVHCHPSSLSLVLVF